MGTTPLEGFERIVPESADMRDQGRYLCGSGALLEAFLESGTPCLSKPLPPDDLARQAYNLRSYRRRHIGKFGNVGISARNGRLTLYLVDGGGPPLAGKPGNVG